MFDKILIANRGEIACRVACTARRLGVRTVAVFSDADAHAAHVLACDEAVHIGPSTPAQSYLLWERIVQAARDTGAQAVHPGYGFLSENAAFAQACADAGLVFIGPSPAALRAMGLKAQSKQLMAQAGVPLVPGYHGADQSPALLQSEADRIGYPVLIKASAGGGGKGMRVVEAARDFASALASCQREAASSFGDEAVLVEKYVQHPRHIEVQVFGDTHGNLVHLFERDCSVQRRHQKVLEEAPAPGMTAALRERMTSAALAAARAVDYVGAGTVEFIVEQASSDAPDPAGPGEFFFMEMNTRLQVEHPVTEAITGLDLVEWQLRVACGEPLPLKQADIRMHGHAIEARLCAEAPERQFLPATGRLDAFHQPQATRFVPAPEGVRIDAGVRVGDAISPYYDSMIAKLIAHATTRAQALARLDAALSQTHVVGLSSNVQFLRDVLTSPSFVQARLDTALIERERGRWFQQQSLPTALACVAALAHLLLLRAASVRADGQGWIDPWSHTDSWQSNGPQQERWTLSRDTRPLALSLSGDGLAVEGVDGGAPQPWSYGRPDLHSAVQSAAQPAGEGALWLQWQGQRHGFRVIAQGPQLHVFHALGACVIDGPEVLKHFGQTTALTGSLAAPMPGKVLTFAVRVGEAVKAGQTLAVMEAMKMEHAITAPADGVVAELFYAPGEQVAEGAPLLRLDSSTTTNEN